MIFGDSACPECRRLTSGTCGKHVAARPMTTPDPALVERARALLEPHDGPHDTPAQWCFTCWCLENKLDEHIAAFAAGVAEEHMNPRSCQPCDGAECERCGGTGFYCVSCVTYTRAADLWQAVLAGQLAATERATETAGKWLRAYQDAYGKLQATEASEARLREAARMMIAEAEGDVTGEYSSPGIRLLRALLEEPTG